jgi:hypothetical protein
LLVAEWNADKISRKFENFIYYLNYRASRNYILINMGNK